MRRYLTGIACIAVGWSASIASTLAEPFPSTYQALASKPTLISNATILTGDGTRLDGASMLLANGKVQWVGNGDIPDNVRRIDAAGRWVTPGIIDVHSHLGVYPSPDVRAHSDGN